MGKWSKRARAVIDRVVAENPDAKPDAVFDLANRAYPFGERSHHPYKVWRAEMAALRLRLVPDGSPESRPCGACGAKPGHPCTDYEAAMSGAYVRGPAMLGFHEARIQPTSGPLFTNPMTAHPRGEGGE